MDPKKNLMTIAAVYQIPVFLLVGAGIVVDFFELFGVDWNTSDWRSSIACAAAWFIMELPLLAFIGYKLFRLRETEA